VLGLLLHISNLYFFSALSNVFLGAMIPVIILKTLREVKLLDNTTIRYTCYFAMFSPIMMDMPELTRDLHITLIYTLLMYIAFIKEIKFRYLFMTMLVVCTFYFRFENGLFAVLFLLLRVFIGTKRSRLTRFLLIPLLLYGLNLFANNYFSEVFDTLIRYNNHSIESASSDSLAISAFYYLPFPLNIIGKTFFGQMIPFPVTSTFRGEGVAKLATVVSWTTPFFWIPIQIHSLYYFVIRYKYVYQKYYAITLFYLLSLFYILSISAGQAMHRRLMPMYPFILVFFCIACKDDKEYYRKSIFTTVAVILVFLHILYYFIK
jgi:hypothetical protein